jgi:hypothetical protein
VRLLGHAEPLEWVVDDGVLTAVLPERLPAAAVTALDLGAGLQERRLPRR